MVIRSSIAKKVDHFCKIGTLHLVRESSCTSSYCIWLNSHSAFCPCQHFTCPNIMVLQVTTSWDGILLNTLQESSLLPQFAYMSTKLFATKTTDSKPLWMIRWWTHLPSSTTTMLAHAISTPTKATELGCTPSCCISLNSSSTFCACPHVTSQNHCAPTDHILRWHLVEHSQSVFKAPTFCIHVHQATPTKTSNLEPLWMTWSWTLLPSSSAPMLTHAFQTPIKVIESGCTPSCCMCQNSSSAFCSCPHFTFPNIMAFQVTTFWNGILLNTFCASSMLPHFGHMSNKVLLTKTLDSQPSWMRCSWTNLPIFKCS